MGKLGIDISEHNGYIDFAKLKQTAVEFVIIRIGWIGNKNNHTIDKYFEDYYIRKLNIREWNYFDNIEHTTNNCCESYNNKINHYLNKIKNFQIIIYSQK